MLSEEELTQLEAQHGRVKRLLGKKDRKGIPEWEIVIRAPRRPEYKNFKALSHNPKTASDAVETAIRMVVVHPPKEAIDALLDQFPGIPEACIDSFYDLAGVNADEAAKT